MLTYPAISGIAAVGQTLTATQGTWLNQPTAYQYQWYADGVAIPGATSSSFTVTLARDGDVLYCEVTAINGAGSTKAASANTLPVYAAAPVNTSPAVITGNGAIGATLTALTGTWSNNPSSFAYQWQRDGVNIAGATAATYVAVEADATKTISCVVTATNVIGTSSPSTAAGMVIYDAAAFAAFSAMSVQPTSARKLLIHNLIASLKTAGVWARLD